MPKLTWNQPHDKQFENGVDRGVIYVPRPYLDLDGLVPQGFAWNGLTSVVEKNAGSAEPVYFDGRKIRDELTIGEFSATLSAIMYPDEVIECEGTNPCPLADACRLRSLLRDAQEAFFASLDAWTIGDMTQPPTARVLLTLTERPAG